MLDLAQLRDFTALARELSLDVLLEVHDERELERALQVDCELIGINNRDLRTFVTDLATTERLAQLVPGNRLIVAESGIHRRVDVERLLRAGARAFLVGESLMREADIGAKLGELLGEHRTVGAILVTARLYRPWRSLCLPRANTRLAPT